MEKEKTILRVEELNSQDMINSPVRAVRQIERITDSLFSTWTYENSLLCKNNKSYSEEDSRQKLTEIREMKKAVKRAVFADNYDCFIRWEFLYGIIKNNQWTFNAIEYIEIYLATQKDCLSMYTGEKVVFDAFDYIVSTFAEASNGDREVFLKTIKEYNNLPVIKVNFEKEDLHRKTLEEKRDFVQQIFLENFNPEIPLELWLNIHFDANKYERGVFAQEFQKKPYTTFLKELDKMQTTSSTPVLT